MIRVRFDDVNFCRLGVFSSNAIVPDALRLASGPLVPCALDLVLTLVETRLRDTVSVDW